MCNYSKFVADRGEERGMAKGMAQGEEKGNYWTDSKPDAEHSCHCR